MVESRTIYHTKQRSRAKILEFYPAQTEPKIYLQICYPSPTEARLPSAPARIKPGYV
jgi:hypothetical protein